MSKIEWTDHTFNPWIGCSHYSPGCANCYAETLMDKRYHRVKWGEKGTRSRTSEANWKQPHRWNRKAAERGVTETVFCASLADVFEDRDELIDWRLDLFDTVIDKTPNLIWLLLTKRVDVAAQFLRFRPVPSNVWLGHSICTQQEADTIIPKLAKLRKRVGGIFLSCEPLLEPLNLGIASLASMAITGRRYYQPSGGVAFWKERWNEKLEVIPPPVDWIIGGAESGSGARPCDVAWIRSIRDQCRASPDEVCPLLPSPARDPRRADNLVREYRKFFFDELELDPRDFIYASESNPFDVYRRLRSAVEHYKNALETIDGCRIAFSALSSKLMSLGVLLAAYETKIMDPHLVGVAHADSHGYRMCEVIPDSELFGLWIAGECYD